MSSKFIYRVYYVYSNFVKNLRVSYREQFSTVTSFIDASTVYGSDDKFHALLREEACFST